MTEPSGKPPTQQRNPFRLGFAVWLATGFWIGLIPFAPGTWGALWGIPLSWGVAQLPALWMQAAAIAVICAAGIPLCSAAARRLGGRKDPGSIVFDEIASLPITFFLVPLDRPATVIAGFLLHRIFDILKPQPARALERLPEGLGIMADDWIAGLYSSLALHLLVWLNPGSLFGP
jgi:phosphatidylglycerophosphatase A